jgi:hypothetical protein
MRRVAVALAAVTDRLRFLRRHSSAEEDLRHDRAVQLAELEAVIAARPTNGFTLRAGADETEVVDAMYKAMLEEAMKEELQRNELDDIALLSGSVAQLARLPEDPLDVGTQHLLERAPKIHDEIAERTQLARVYGELDDLTADLADLTARLTAASPPDFHIISADNDSVRAALDERRDQINRDLDKALATCLRDTELLRRRLTWVPWIRVAILLGVTLLGLAIDQIGEQTFPVQVVVLLTVFVIIEMGIVDGWIEPRFREWRARKLIRETKSVCDSYRRLWTQLDHVTGERETLRAAPKAPRPEGG